MANVEQAETPAKARKDRSPNYPALTISEALDQAHKIWTAEKRHPMSLELAAQHAGYKKLTGTSAPAMAALKRYGLLESVGGGREVRISDDANYVFVHPDGHPDRQAMIRRLAMRPELFAEILKVFPDGLPSDANLRAKLRIDWKFASDAAADTLIRALREAINIAGVTENPSDTRENIEEPASRERPAAQVVPAVAAAMRTSATTSTNFNDNTDTQSRPWDLGDGVVMVVILPHRLSKKNIQRLKRYVSALETEASIGWDDAEEA